MSKIKIVLAEDEPSLGQILKESLEKKTDDNDKGTILDESQLLED